ncbi:TIR domain-containing protein [Lacticaseibacillus rhamnosus]|uniref:TIR domain-containing protein n=1 Tax=Lacticaseibacillus rhamnosus TaxID=47715 RepID=UPI0023E2C658|nr:TIR domain-containing protein [Lacticaseibacillus rhamnosus]MDF3335230.1 TIR domain-containing protein [Lacticaseibacillus rhamnosus]
MSHKTFISYKYSEAKDLRDHIIARLGEDAKYYKGENNDTQDISDRKNETIREHLKEMIYGTSVTIVIISPNMRESAWIDWELEYALKEVKRGDKTSHSNGIVGIVMNDPDTSWLRKVFQKPDSHTSSSFVSSYLPDIVKDNRFNQDPKEYFCDQCKTTDALTGSYISLIDEDEFLGNPSKYIDNAYDKSQNLNNYILTKLANSDHESIL